MFFIDFPAQYIEVERPALVLADGQCVDNGAPPDLPVPTDRPEPKPLPVALRPTAVGQLRKALEEAAKLGFEEPDPVPPSMPVGVPTIR